MQLEGQGFVIIISMIHTKGRHPDSRILALLKPTSTVACVIFDAPDVNSFAAWASQALVRAKGICLSVFGSPQWRGNASQQAVEGNQRF